MNDPNSNTVQGLLIDLEGVLYVGDRLIPGCTETLLSLRERGVSCRYLTNTTTKSLDSLHQKLTRMGLPIEKSEIISAPQAAVRFLRRQTNPTCWLLLNDDTQKDFFEFPQSETGEFIVIGDIGNRWNYDLVNQIFARVASGATMVALHKGKYWQAEEGLRVDIGAFVAGLEYAASKPAVVMGKPSPEFFQIALDDMDLPKEQVAMIGDDIDADIGGAQALGIKGILVKTGKYRDELASKSSVHPYAVIPSFIHFLDCFVLARSSTSNRRVTEFTAFFCHMSF